MILERLKAFWDEQPDTMRPGYQKALLTKWVKLDAQGNPLGPAVPLTGDGTKVRDGKRVEVPREQPQRTSGVRARLVHDNGRYVLGLLGEGDKPDRVAQAHRAYVELLRGAHEATGDGAFAAVLRWIEAGAADAAETLGIEANDDLWITVDGVDPTESETAEAFWNLPSGKDAITMRCMVTGELAEVGKAMPYPIKRIPGGQMSGNMLVSVNFAAAQSYGLEGNLNSPISKTAAEAICNALNRLLASADHSYRVGETVYVYWIRGQAERDALRALKDPTPEEIDPLKARFKARPKKEKPDPRRVGGLVSAPMTGATPTKTEPKDVVVTALTANASRIAVRDYHELTMAKLDERIGEWFARLELTSLDGNSLRLPKLNWLAYSLFRDKKDMPKHIPVLLADSALNGTRLPDTLLVLAVRRNVVENGPFVRDRGIARLSYARLALIKAILTDRYADLELSEMITTIPQPTAYVCGRLLAVLDTIQYYALRDPKTKKAKTNATLVDKHYGSFSTAPNVSIGPLMSLATKAHLPKIRKASPGVCAALTVRLEEIMLLIDGVLPPTFDYADQGLFALGYYHQKAHDRAESRKAKAAGVETPLADLAEGNDIEVDDSEENS